jgi:hypothetical protein
MFFPYFSADTRNSYNFNVWSVVTSPKKDQTVIICKSMGTINIIDVWFICLKGNACPYIVPIKEVLLNNLVKYMALVITEYVEKHLLNFSLQCFS